MYLHIESQLKKNSNFLPLSQDKSLLLDESFQEESQRKFNPVLVLMEIRQQFHTLNFIKYNCLIQKLMPVPSNFKKELQEFSILNFDDFPIFFQLELALNLNFQALLEKCREAFIQDEFQQMNYQRFDLTYCSDHTMKWLVQEHHNLVNDLTIRGLTLKELKTIVHDYCISNDIEKESIYLETEEKEGKQKKGPLLELEQDQSYKFQPLKENNSAKKKETVKKVKTLISTAQSSSSSNSVVKELNKKVSQINKSNKILYQEMLELKKQCIAENNDKDIDSGIQRVNVGIYIYKKEFEEQKSRIEEITNSLSKFLQKKKK